MTANLTLNFKKGCHFEIAFATLMKMFMNTLREVLSVDCTTVISTPVSYCPFSLTDVVMPTGSACQGIYEVTCVASEMMTDFKRLICSFESD